ncbi:MAG: 23S rRNA (adenine(2503)-C(2))-methyltransferase RlmN [Treponema sp.]|jgi:23S rRNA (adenine2503-C2)-methyltransferase|nr:23S rRNA (adenine(2503)-C(2))-methyltransferase RlmN [Treponema sp.]
MASSALCGLPLNELAELLAPLPRFRALQIFKWIAKGAVSFDEMSSLPQPLRTELSGRFSIRLSAVENTYTDTDGTIKLALKLFDGAIIEAVLLEDSAGRRTACISTQAGCPAGCVFCKTGSLGFLRNLSSSEIVEQLLFLTAAANNTATADKTAGHVIDNIVIMGMGEALLNLAELRRALTIITSGQGMNFSKRRITLSTCGIAEGIIDLADKGPDIRLALSLTTADESLRQKLMPITAAQPLHTVKEALRYYQRKGGKRITLEVVLLGGINTRGEDAVSIAEFAKGLDAAVNVIPWNPVEGLEPDGLPLRPPSTRETEAFIQRLESLGLNVTRRFRRGRGIMGACGQLGQLSLH